MHTPRLPIALPGQLLSHVPSAALLTFAPERSEQLLGLSFGEAAIQITVRISFSGRYSRYPTKVIHLNMTYNSEENFITLKEVLTGGIFWGKILQGPYRESPGSRSHPWPLNLGRS